MAITASLGSSTSDGGKWHIPCSQGPVYIRTLELFAPLTLAIGVDRGCTSGLISQYATALRTGRPSRGGPCPWCLQRKTLGFCGGSIVRASSQRNASNFCNSRGIGARSAWYKRTVLRVSSILRAEYCAVGRLLTNHVDVGTQQRGAR